VDELPLPPLLEGGVGALLGNLANTLRLVGGQHTALVLITMDLITMDCWVKWPSTFKLRILILTNTFTKLPFMKNCPEVILISKVTLQAFFQIFTFKLFL
jgi:hypothetical protein